MALTARKNKELFSPHDKRAPIGTLIIILENEELSGDLFMHVGFVTWPGFLQPNFLFVPINFAARPPFQASSWRLQTEILKGLLSFQKCLVSYKVQ